MCQFSVDFYIAVVMLYLGGDIIGCSTEGFSCLIILNVFFTHAKISNLNMAVLIQQDIVQLQVTINDANSVKEKQSNGNFSCVKSEGVTKKLGKSVKCRGVNL